MIRRWALPLLLLAFGVFYLLPLATHGLWIPDETRYAQISQEMLLTGKWASPHFMGIRYFEKPAAGYWMIALGQAIFGQNLFGVRFASALSTGLSILLVYLVSRRLWNDPQKSLVSTVLYMSFVSVAALGGYANLDPQFTFWVNLTGVALWFCFDSTSRNGRLGSWALLGFACGMGFMTKGFLAWLLPVLIALPYAIWQKRFRELLGYGLVAVVVAIAVSLPWALAVHLQEPDYWNFFWHEHIQRFAGEDAQHAEPFWYYLPLLVAFSLPWVALLPSTLKQAWQEKRAAKTAFLLLWLLMPLAFFSLAKGKLPSYIMPCLLPLALLMGSTLADKLAAGRGRVAAYQRLAEPGDWRRGVTGADVVSTEEARLRTRSGNPQPGAGVSLPVRLDHRQPAASVTPAALVGSAGSRQLVAGGVGPGRTAPFGGLQQDSGPVHHRSPPGAEPDQRVARAMTWAQPPPWPGASSART